MMRTLAVRGLLLALAFAAGTSTASAQVFGTFPWQMQPYCNKVTLTLTSVTGNFALDGFDDQCGATTKASAYGIGVFNPDGSVGLNFTIVTSPGGKPVHVSAIVSPANGNGTWTDSVGNSGAFAFFGSLPGLPVRPLPASGVGPASITSIELAPSAVGSSQIAAGAVGQSEIATDGVGPSELQAGSVSADELDVITRRSATSAAIAPGASGSAAVQCLVGERVLSGGNDASSALNVVIVASRNDGAQGWRVFARNDGAANNTVTVHAYCLAP